jgi:hypothetical protein
MATNKVSKSGAPGGGHRSRQVREVGVRTGAARHGVNERWTSQVGQSYGNHATEKRGMLPRDKVIEKYHAGPGLSVPLGNSVALNVGRGGPGTGRNLYGQSGSNQTYGPVAGNPKPQGRDILSDFGPDFRRRGSR